jgi:aminoglycoside phosphotransferase (APT) family kinase protein
MMAGDSAADLERSLSRVLGERLAGFRSLRSCDRLSGGASQETYRVVADTESGERRLAMRRSPAGVTRQTSSARSVA